MFQKRTIPFRLIIVVLVESITWLLFGVATFLLARQTWFVVQGRQPDYTGEQAAFIVAGIVTATWLVMLARIVLQIDRTPVDWVISLVLLIAGIGVDVAVAVSFVFSWQFPVHIALLVIVAHALAHVIQWIVAAAQQAAQRFGAEYQSPEEQIAEARQQAADAKITQAAAESAKSLLEQTVSELRAHIQDLENKLQQAEAEKHRVYEWICPDCGAPFRHATQESIDKAARTHLNQRCPKRHERRASGNGIAPRPQSERN